MPGYFRQRMVIDTVSQTSCEQEGRIQTTYRFVMLTNQTPSLCISGKLSALRLPLFTRTYGNHEIN